MPAGRVLNRLSCLDLVLFLLQKIQNYLQGAFSEVDLILNQNWTCCPSHQIMRRVKRPDPDTALGCCFFRDAGERDPFPLIRH